MATTAVDDIASSLTGEIIKVYVGAKRKKYQVHADLLSSSEWLRVKIYPLRGHCKDHTTSHIYLPNQDPPIFDLLVTWLYRRSLPAISLGDEDVAKKQAADLVLLYLQSQAWKIPDLQNSIMDTLGARPTCALGWFPCSLISTIYTYSTQDDQLRTYVVDNFVFKSATWAEGEDSDSDSDSDDPAFTNRATALRKHMIHGNHTFVAECYEALFQQCAKSRFKDPNRTAGCAYHRHEGRGKCR